MASMQNLNQINRNPQAISMMRGQRHVMHFSDTGADPNDKQPLINVNGHASHTARQPTSAEEAASSYSVFSAQNDNAPSAGLNVGRNSIGGGSSALPGVIQPQNEQVHVKRVNVNEMVETSVMLPDSAPTLSMGIPTAQTHHLGFPSGPISGGASFTDHLQDEINVAASGTGDFGGIQNGGSVPLGFPIDSQSCDSNGNPIPISRPNKVIPIRSAPDLMTFAPFIQGDDNATIPNNISMPTAVPINDDAPDNGTNSSMPMADLGAPQANPDNGTVAPTPMPTPSEAPANGSSTSAPSSGADSTANAPSTHPKGNHSHPHGGSHSGSRGHSHSKLGSSSRKSHGAKGESSRSSSNTITELINWLSKKMGADGGNAPPPDSSGETIGELINWLMQAEKKDKETSSADASQSSSN